jgi:aspartyl protease family protein
MSRSVIAFVVIGAVAGFMIPTRGEDEGPAARAAETPSGPHIPVETRIRRSPNGHFYVTAEVNGQPVRFVVDTGASGVALTEDDAKRAGVRFDPADFDYVGQGAAGPIQGQRVNLASVVLDGKERLHVSGAVLQGADLSLLGQSYLSRLRSVEMRGDEMILR